MLLRIYLRKDLMIRIPLNYSSLIGGNTDLWNIGIFSFSPYGAIYILIQSG